MQQTRTIVVAFALAVAAIVAVASSAEAHEPPPSSCDPADPPSCLYVPEVRYTPRVVDGVVLVDPDRDGYRVPLLVRYPEEATGQRPVVIWNHGGNPSEIGMTRSEDWGIKLARAGYIVIHPSRTLPEDLTDLRPECEDNGFADPVECAQWVAQMRYGPENVHFIIDRLDEIAAARPILHGRFDVSKIVVAGHSAGTTTVLATAGARQRWTDEVYEETDDRPIAFLATAPMGPTYAGFRSGFDEEESFLELSRPLLFVTGMGDETGEPLPTRLTAWLTSQRGDKALAWDTEPEAVHETMNIHKCDTALQDDHCEWIGSLGVAYLDAVVRHRPEAVEWMRSDAFEIATSGAIELHRR